MKKAELTKLPLEEQLKLRKRDLRSARLLVVSMTKKLREAERKFKSSLNLENNMKVEVEKLSDKLNIPY